MDGIEAIDLCKSFGPFVAVSGVSFSVPRGEVLGFLGPNGAGKSTTMKMLTGFLPPTAGSARVCGHNVAAEPIAAKRSLGYLPERGPLYGEMTTLEFLHFIGRARDLSGAARRAAIERVIDLCRLGDMRHRLLGTLSKGYRQRVGLAQALLHDPPCLILDEPTDGLDPNQKDVVRALIRSMRADKAIILSTHILEEVEALCSRVIIINRGRLLAEAPPETLRIEHGTLEQAFRVITTGSDQKPGTNGKGSQAPRSAVAASDSSAPRP
jgi:ABC-2 type transport system ATP-binding protein